MNKIKLIFLIFIFACQGHAKEISLSFDDAPRGSTLRFSGMERTKKLIQDLKELNIKKVAFYVNTKQFPKSNGLERVWLYKKAGHIIGNHTHSHINIKKNTVKDYLKNFDKAHKILLDEGLLDYYFRYPYLRRGKTIDEVQTIHKYVLSNGYLDAFVTVDNYDFYMEDLFQRALLSGKKVNYENLKKFYVETLYKGIEFYDELSRKALGKSVKHVMLLHENDLAVLFIKDLVGHLRKNGWKIITPEESYTDPITKYFPKEVLVHGQGRVNALAAEAGYKGPIQSGYENKPVLDKLFKEYKVVE